MSDGKISYEALKAELSKAEAELEVLRKSEKRFHSTLDSMIEGCQIIGFDWTYLYLNNAAAVQNRRSNNELLGRKMTEVWPGIEASEVFAMLRHSMEERVSLQKQLKYDFPDGDSGWFEVKCQPVPEGIFVQHLDITEHIESRQALNVSEERFRRALENIPDVIVIYDSDLRIQYINAATKNITGQPESFFLGNRDEDILPPEVCQVYLPMLNESLHSGKTMSLESEIPIPGHDPVYLRITCIPVTDEEGNVVEVIGVNQDLTEERKTKADILEKNQFIESILNFTPDLLYLYDIIEQKNVYSNKGIQVVLGYSVDEIQAMGSDLMPCLMHPGDFQDYCEKTYPIYSTTPDNTEITHQYRFKHKDGEWRWLDFCEFIYSREPDGSPRQIFGVAQDVTEKLSLEEQLRHIQKMEAVGRLAGGVAHDFNNQLGVILGYGENLIGKLHDSDPLQKDAKEIVAAGKRSAALTRQLLTFSRKQTLQFKLIDLNDLIRNLDKMLRRLIGEDIQLELKLSHNPVIINVDLVQIEQVILNLAINSRDAMPQGGELIIETSCTDLDESYATKHDGVVPGHYVLLTVSDTGCGMDEETLCRIFEPFFTTKGLGRGTGLGLATVYGIVKQSGGSLRAYSEPGKGTTFKIYLPLIEGVVETEKVKLTEKIYNGQVEHILLVEDDDSLRTLFTIMLSEIGYQITTAANGDEALLLVEEKGLRPDLMITDVIMPGMSGSVLIDRLSKTMPNLKFIYMSGYTDDSISHHGVLDSDTPFIQKPFNTEDIIAKINEVMAAGDK